MTSGRELFANRPLRGAINAGHEPNVPRVVDGALVVDAIGALVMRGNAKDLRTRSRGVDSLFVKRIDRERSGPCDSASSGGGTLRDALSAC